MKVLITGSSGFLGKEFIRLINKKNTIVLFIKKNKKKNFIYCPLQNHKNLKKILKIIKPDTIINLAAEVNFKKKTRNMYKVNSQPLKIFSQYCAKEKNILFNPQEL